MKITAVIVFYKLKPEQSKTLESIKNILMNNSEASLFHSLLLYDNSPESHQVELRDINGVDVLYIHDSRNLGIAAAYNYALDAAQKNGSEWLLLLDQDTELTENYIEKAFTDKALDNKKDKIAAVIPKIYNENTMISPVKGNTLRPLREELPMPGLHKKPIMGINSGAFININFLNEIGGFNTEFSLDYLDHWLFHEIYSKGYSVLVLDVEIKHDLSVMDYSKVSLSRYQSILDSEINYYKNYNRNLYKQFRIQLLKRFFKQILTVKDKRISLYTLKKLFS